MKRFIPIAITSIIAICTACSETKSNKNEQGNFKSPEAIQFLDSTSASFSEIKIHDNVKEGLIKKETTEFYRKNNNKSRWLYKKKQTKLLQNYFAELKRAKDYGLDPEHYNYSKLFSRVNNLYEKDTPDLVELENLDKEITVSFLLFMHHLSDGRIVPEGYGDKIWQKEAAKVDRNEVKLLLSIEDKDDLKNILDTIHPAHPFYTNLRNHLRKINSEKEKDIKVFSVKSTRNFKVGYKDSTVAMIRHNLNEWEIPVIIDSNSMVVDSNLISSLKTFQKSRNIAQDGLPGENTLLYLNMTKAKLVSLISLNLERMRWLPENFGENFIFVNVPEFIMRVYNENEVKVKMKVIVGKEYNPTPMFSDTLKYIVFRPTWTVPQSIINGEMIPKLQNDPLYYTKKDFKIYEGGEEINPRTVNWKKARSRYFRFVQQPSSSNALGLVKFIFPNDMSIYLHDTPSDYLFDREERAMSHGCVRVEYPADLATYLLRNVKGWDRAKVESSLANGDTKRVDLSTNYHVQIAYLTTWMNEDGELKIAEDVYGHDKRQLEELNAL